MTLCAFCQVYNGKFSRASLIEMEISDKIFWRWLYGLAETSPPLDLILVLEKNARLSNFVAKMCCISQNHERQDITISGLSHKKKTRRT